MGYQEIIPGRHLTRTLLFLTCFPLSIGLRAATPETPVGLVVLASGGSKLVRAKTETPLAARPGDLLFTGDGLRTDNNASASFLFCPKRVIETLSPAGEVQFDVKQSRVKRGKASEQPARACALPQVLRIAVASQQHIAVSMIRGLPSDFPPVPRDQLPPEIMQELAPIETALQSNAREPASLVAAAMVFESHKIYANALEEYNQLREQWPDAEWVKGKIFDLEKLLAEQNAERVNAVKGKTFALVIGVSKYLKPDLNLQFAHRDAQEFGKLLQTPRVGGVPLENIDLLTDEHATKAAIENGFQDFLRHRASKSDTVIILVAGHGLTQGNVGAYILPYDADPQDLKSTALSVGDLQQLFEEQLKTVARVVMFLDVCKAGAVGVIKEKNRINKSLPEQLAAAEGSLTGIMAAGPNEFSFEGPQYGGGHGAFTHFVIQGLAGAAAKEGSESISARELFDYVYNHVKLATGDEQHPRDFGVFENKLRLADLGKPGIQVSRWRTFRDLRFGGLLYLAALSAPWLDRDGDEDLEQFTAALRAGRLLPSESENAFEALGRLKNDLAADEYFKRENQLRIALEDRAQGVLLGYLAGDQIPQNREAFDLGARYMAVARRLTRESLYLEGREDFFHGRTLLFDKKYPQATNLLEQAVRIDPGAGYTYNALGIGYLEQADYSNAIHAFRDASHLAPYWAYPLHNLALAYTQIGNYTAALQAYREGMDLAPQYAYLPYNAGLVYQRLNKRKEAESSYLKAMELAPDLAEPYNALGYLRESQGRAGEAEDLYRRAVQKNPDLLAARQNLAVLIFHQRDRADEAIGLWRLNLAKQTDYLPSRLSLAKGLAELRRLNEAIQEYRTAAVVRPDYVAVRLALADLYEKNQNLDDALIQLKNALEAQPSNPEVLERLGDLQARRGQTVEALESFNKALSLSHRGSNRKRIRSKIKMITR